jgi:hypothetical protein
MFYIWIGKIWKVAESVGKNLKRMSQYFVPLSRLNFYGISIVSKFKKSDTQ